MNRSDDPRSSAARRVVVADPGAATAVSAALAPAALESTPDDEGHEGALRSVPIAWQALEDAFENNAPEVHSYLNLATGEVVRIVDGVADPAMHQRVSGDNGYLRVEPVSSREQYRWMERFIATLEEGELRERLVHAIDGKGAFRRFKDALMAFPVDRERWFAFRTERLRACMESWLETHRLTATERREWRVPTAEDVTATVEVEPARPRRARSPGAEAARRRLHDLAEALPARELDAALAFLEFLRAGRPGASHEARAFGDEGDPADGEPHHGDAEHSLAREG